MLLSPRDERGLGMNCSGGCLVLEALKNPQRKGRNLEKNSTFSSWQLSRCPVGSSEAGVAPWVLVQLWTDLSGTGTASARKGLRL